MPPGLPTKQGSVLQPRGGLADPSGVWNELKANLFLLKEEPAHFQRWCARQGPEAWEAPGVPVPWASPPASFFEWLIHLWCRVPAPCWVLRTGQDSPCPPGSSFHTGEGQWARVSSSGCHEVLPGRGDTKLRVRVSAECSQKGKQHAQVLESRPILSIPTALSLPFLLSRELLTACPVPASAPKP